MSRPLTLGRLVRLRSQPSKRRRLVHLKNAFNEALDAAQNLASGKPPFNKTLDNHCACYGLSFKELLRYVFPLECGTHTAQDAEHYGYDSSHEAGEGVMFESEFDSREGWPADGESLTAQQLDIPAAAGMAPSDAAT